MRGKNLYMDKDFPSTKTIIAMGCIVPGLQILVLFHFLTFADVDYPFLPYVSVVLFILGFLLILNDLGILKRHVKKIN